MRSETFTPDGEVLNTTVGSNRVVISYTRKMGRENYGGEEAFVSMQLDIDPDASPVDVEAVVAGGFAFAKTVAYQQLGLESTVDDNNIVRDVPQPQKESAKKSGGSKPAAKKTESSGEPVDKDQLWTDLAEAAQNANGGRIEGFYDNRGKKASGDYSSRAPDFKHIESDTGLWLNKAPEFVKAALAA